MRLFISIDLDELTEPIEAAQDPFRGLDGVRLTEPSQVHITLKFLGTVNSDRLPAITTGIEESVAKSGVTTFNVRIGGYGVFPSPEYISVIWVGLTDGGTEVTRLHETLEARMIDLGFEPEDHEFTPHATIARMDHPAAKATVQNTVRERELDAGSMRVSEIRLIESTLTSEGPEYESLASVSL